MCSALYRHQACLPIYNTGKVDVLSSSRNFFLWGEPLIRNTSSLQTAHVARSHIVGNQEVSIHLGFCIQKLIIFFLLGMSVLLLKFLTGFRDYVGMACMWAALARRWPPFQTEDPLCRPRHHWAWKHPVFSLLGKTVEFIPLRSHKRDSCHNLE